MKRIILFTLLLLSLTMMGQTRLYVKNGESIGAALEQARAHYERDGSATVIAVEPGTYYEQLTIDVPNLTICNASRHPSIAVHEGGVKADADAVRISWYCGHGYQYGSMGSAFNYGGSRTRLWNASVLVDAPGFTAENIIFENSYNIYVSEAELRDTLLPMGPDVSLEVLHDWGVDIQRLTWTEKEQPKRAMPDRPRQLNSTEVQKRYYRERASALSFTGKAQHCVLNNCRVLGRQDAFYGDHGAEVRVNGGVLAGAVDYIFGGLTLEVNRAQLVAMVNTEKGDVCYISAGRGASRAKLEKAHGMSPDQLSTMGLTPQALDSIPQNEVVEKGMVFNRCTVRFATEDELVNPGSQPVYLGRPWRWWGETIFVRTKAKNGVLNKEHWSLGLTKGHVAPWSEDGDN